MCLWEWCKYGNEAIKIKSKGSLVFRTSVLIALILFLQVSLLIANNAYSYSRATQNILDSQKSTMAVALEQARNDLKHSTSILNELSGDYINYSDSNFTDKSELNRYFALIDLASQLEAKISNNEMIECLFFSSKINDSQLTRYNSQIFGMQKLEIDDFIKNNKGFENDAIDENWHIVSINGVNYIMQVFSLDTADIGVLIKINHFVQMIENMTDQTKSQYVFADNEGNIIGSGTLTFLSENNKIDNSTDIVTKYEKQYLLITKALGKTPMLLTCIVKRSDVYLGIDVVQWMVILFSLISIFIILVSILYLKKFIITPIKELVIATKEVEKGNLDYQMTEEVSTSEFELLINSFNGMTKEIKTLKILSYEEKIEKHKAELKYLQMQIRPHFYLNAINTISSLSLQKSNEEINKFIIALSNYLRYMFTDNLALVTVKNEVDHAVDYIKLQQIKFPNMIFYMTEINKECTDFLLPKFLIQTFVENIFKHAFYGDNMLSIFIRADYIENAGEEYAKIIIEDNGEGFDESYLNGGSFGKENIGITNIKKTLELTYGRDNLLTLSNNDEGGARVEVRIPKSVNGSEKQ